LEDGTDFSLLTEVPGVIEMIFADPGVDPDLQPLHAADCVGLNADFGMTGRHGLQMFPRSQLGSGLELDISVSRHSPANAGRHGEVEKIAVHGNQVTPVELAAEHGIREEFTRGSALFFRRFHHSSAMVT
jgi:hypothetical protein